MGKMRRTRIAIRYPQNELATNVTFFSMPYAENALPVA
jgi:hypothetical protein